jgi:hypothetical protein
MSRADLESVVLPFYTHALTVNSSTTSTAVLEKILAEDFQSVNGQETKSKAVLIKQVEFFWKLIPDLAWTPADVLVDGNKVVVRSVATGKPRGAFMGLELDGTRAFRIDTIDILDCNGGSHGKPFATNFNPGSSPCLSMPMMIALAVRHCGLSPQEAIVASTVNAAHVLALQSRGTLTVGARADILVLHTTDERSLAYEFGMNPVERLFIAGVEQLRGHSPAI